jgi:GT2 family glycosyltransferase
VQPVLDLVACAYQAPEATEAFLYSLANVGLTFTLCVIENSSPDDSVRQVLKGPALDAVRALPNCKDATIIFNETNVGYARAINHGVSLGTAPYVAALNTDVQFLQEDAAQTCVAFLDRHEDVGIVGPRTVDEFERFTHAGIIASGSMTEQHRYWLHHDVGQASDVLDVPTVSGATYFFRRRMWEQLTDCPLFRQVAPEAEGAFLPTRHFYEETYCSYHARLHDWRVVYLGTAKMIHLWHRSSTVGSQDILGPRAYFLRALEAHGLEA